MSERKYGEICQDLTYRDCHLKGQNEKQKAEMAERHVRTFLTALHKEAKKMDWRYTVTSCGSATDPRTGKSVRQHVHLLITGTPALEIAKWTKIYWQRRYGWADFVPCDNVSGFLRYMYEQRQFMWERKREPLNSCDQVLNSATAKGDQTIDNTGVGEDGEPYACFNKEYTETVNCGTGEQVPQPRREIAAELAGCAVRQSSKRLVMKQLYGLRRLKPLRGALTCLHVLGRGRHYPVVFNTG